MMIITPYGYNWQRRNDPGSRSYYNRDRWAIRNILASNIGLTAKRGTDNSVVIAVSNILTTEPMKGSVSTSSITSCR